MVQDSGAGGCGAGAVYTYMDHMTCVTTVVFIVQLILHYPSYTYIYTCVVGYAYHNIFFV